MGLSPTWALEETMPPRRQIATKNNLAQLMVDFAIMSCDL
jgi:hypothetical protein